MALFHQAAFFKSVTSATDLPAESASEVAFAGRSNAGKSSAINAILGRKRLAFVSKTPGRTREINFFALGGGRYLVDLPGYGYAKVARSAREPWARLLGAYLQERSQLACLVVVMDARHPMTEIDRQLLDWFAPTGKPLHVLLSKADKLSHSQAVQLLRSVSKQLAARSPNWSAQLFSSSKKTGLEQAEETCAHWLGPPVKAAKTAGGTS